MSTETLNMPAATDFSVAFRELLGLLCREPFAISNGFDSLTIEDIGLILEEPFGGDDHLVESYDCCKSTYCLMLIELELGGHLVVPQSLSKLRLNELSYLAIFEQSSQEKMGATVDETTATHILSKVSEVISNLNEELENEPKTALNEPSQSISDLNKIRLAEKTNQLTQTLSQEYLNLASYFQLNAMSAKTEPSLEALNRAIVHFHIGACEIELLNCTKENLRTIWPSLCEKIEFLIQKNVFSFNQENQKSIESDEQQFGQWLHQGSFPKLAALHCLKYLTLTRSFEKLHPTVFEFGILFYFWGTVHPSPFDILSGLSREQIIEVAFRLFRLDQLKAHANNFNRNLTGEQVSLAIEDSTVVLELLGLNKPKQPMSEVA